MWRKHDHLPSLQMARVSGNSLNFQPTVAMENDEFIPRVGMTFQNGGETTHRAGRYRRGNFNGAGFFRCRHQNRAAAEIVSARGRAKAENGIGAEPGERLIDKREFRARIGAGAHGGSFANGVVYSGGPSRGLRSEQPHIVDHFRNASLFLVGCEEECGNADSGADQTNDADKV